MVHTFFPFFTEFTQRSTFGHSIFERLFPIDAVDRCPESVYITNSMVIRLPYLGFSAILGIIIGVVGSIIFGLKLQRNFSSMSRIYFYLCMAYAAFGAMNVCGVFIHCIWDAPSPTYPIMTPALWSLDCFFTGVSAFSLAYASLENILPSHLSVANFYSYCMMQVLGMMFLVQFMVDDSATIFLETWYLIPVLLAGHIIVLDLAVEMFQRHGKQDNITNTLSNQQHSLWIEVTKNYGPKLFLLGVAHATGGVFLDASLCSIVGTSYITLDWFSASTCLFFGCDLAFVGLMLVWCNRGNMIKEALHKQC